jgi:hypothetical protein
MGILVAWLNVACADLAFSHANAVFVHMGHLHRPLTHSRCPIGRDEGLMRANGDRSVPMPDARCLICLVESHIRRCVIGVAVSTVLVQSLWCVALSVCVLYDSVF